MAIFELREYKVRPGKMSQWLELMEGEIFPYIVSKGMVISASFCSTEDDTKYIWIRRFKDEEDLQKKCKAVYETEHWIKNVKPKIGELLIREHSVIKRLEPTECSPMQ